MAIQSLPPSARRYTAAQRAEIAAALAALRRAWSRMGSQFDGSWASIEGRVLAVMAVAQSRVAEGAALYVPDVLDDLGMDSDLAAQVVPEALVGVTGDGRSVRGLLGWSTVVAKQAVAGGATVPQALKLGGDFVQRAAATVLSDTGRAVEAVATYVSPSKGYVRMLVGASCSRCAVLAGRWYRRAEAFDRHPGCDCRHIPASESVAGDLTVDPKAYFDSLSPEQQSKVFTVAGAEAIRSGADVGSVVNVRRGMSTAAPDAAGRRRLARRNVYGRDVFTTSESVTSRGRYRGVAPRLMPESIFELAEDRADAMRLLRLNGYIL